MIENVFVKTVKANYDTMTYSVFKFSASVSRLIKSPPTVEAHI